MTAKKPKNEAHREAVRRFHKQVQQAAYKQAKVFAVSDIAAAILEATTEAARVGLLTLYVQTELHTFFAEVLEPMVSTPDGLAWAGHCARSCGGQASGKAQRRNSLKGRVEAFAIALHKSAPTMTKADVRRSYFEEYPADKRSESSESTVERYLKDLW